MSLMRAGICCFAFAPLACSAAEPEPERVVEVERPVQGGVVDTQYPAVGAIWDPIGLDCTATLISPYLVLTAAHCVDPRPQAPPITFYTGTGDALPFGGATTPPPDIQPHAIAAVAQHPSYVAGTPETDFNCPPGSGYDIGLVALQSPILDIAPWEGIRGTPSISGGQACTVVGYGIHDDASGRTYGQRRRASVVVTDAAYGATVPFIEVQGSGGAETGISDSGDSGGPLFCADPATQVTALVGVTRCHNDTPHVLERYTPNAVAGGSTPSVAAGALQALVSQRGWFDDTGDPSAGAMKLLGITSGCTATMYCPFDLASRWAAAIFVVRSLFGENFSSSTAPYFTDVPPSDPGFRYVQKLRDLGITTGCTASAFCPSDAITRGQLAVFLVRARFGEAFSASPSPYFTDVPPSHPFFRYVQKAFELGVLGACGPGTFCPDTGMTRGDVAGPLVKALVYRN
jgi:trypsin/S-layer family protein